MQVTTWTLEQTDLAQLRSSGRPAPDGLEIVRVSDPTPEFVRFLYAAVGGSAGVDPGAVAHRAGAARKRALGGLSGRRAGGLCATRGDGW
jgi:hypothetical protein